MTSTWRIEQLSSIVEKALETIGCNGSHSKRVRTTPDSRTIRYYTTIGLIDPPSEMRGRTAYYQRRHVLQLVCIKRLQADGLSLAEVQRRLAGATTRKLSSLANLPSHFWEAFPADEEVNASQEDPDRNPTGARQPFWQASPAAAGELPTFPVMGDGQNAAAVICVRVPLQSGVFLEIQLADPERLTSETMDALRPALDTLSQELERLGLATPPARAESSDVNPADQEKPS